MTYRPFLKFTPREEALMLKAVEEARQYMERISPPPPPEPSVPSSSFCSRATLKSLPESDMILIVAAENAPSADISPESAITEKASLILWRIQSYKRHQESLGRPPLKGPGSHVRFKKSSN